MMLSNGRRRIVLLAAVGVVSIAVVTHLLYVTSCKSFISTDHGYQQRQQVKYEERVIKVQAVGSFRDRVAAFNAYLSSFRVDELKRRGTRTWQRPGSGQLNVVRGSRDDYLQLLSNYTNVTTVALPWTRNTSRAWSTEHDRSNLLIQTYFEWTADDTLCSWIETPGKIRAKYDVTFNRRCVRNSSAVQPSSLQPLILNGKPLDRNHYWPNGGSSYPARFYVDPPTYAFYMHIHRDAIVTTLGDVISDGLKLVLYACSNDGNPSLPLRLESIPLYDEVFVVTQFWGTGVFHRMVEIVPRIALFVNFLASNPQIRILGPEVGGRLAELLGILGLHPSRLITGEARAKIVYQPRATGCGHANIQESQTLSQIYRDYIKRNFPPQPRNRLLLIRRSESRRFSRQKEIEAVLEQVAKDYNLTYTLFIDNPTPSLTNTMMMFHSAVVVVGPHGGGLSNVFFSEPGTFVVEGVCNIPHVNMCYNRLVQVLGQRWRGVTSRGGCEGVVDVPAMNINASVREYLHASNLR